MAVYYLEGHEGCRENLGLLHWLPSPLPLFLTLFFDLCSNNKCLMLMPVTPYVVMSASSLAQREVSRVTESISAPSYTLFPDSGNDDRLDSFYKPLPGKQPTVSKTS